MKEKIKDSGLTVQSRGLVVLFSEPVNPKVTEILKNHQLFMENHMSVQLAEEDFAAENLILTMDDSQRETIYADFKQAQNVFRFTEFLGKEGDICDPYGGGPEEYEACFQMLEPLIEELIEKIK